MRSVREEALAQILQSRLGEDRRTCGQTIHAAVIGDVAYLLGWVDSDDQRVAASTIVKGTCGVRTVVDRVRVRATVRSLRA